MLKHFFLTYMYQYHSVATYLELLYCRIAHWNFPVLLIFFLNFVWQKCRIMYRTVLWQVWYWHFGNAHVRAEWFKEEATIYSPNITSKWSLNHRWCALGHGFDDNFIQYLSRVPYLSPCFMVGKLSLKRVQEQKKNEDNLVQWKIKFNGQNEYEHRKQMGWSLWYHHFDTKTNCFP